VLQQRPLDRTAHQPPHFIPPTMRSSGAKLSQRRSSRISRRQRFLAVNRLRWAPNCGDPVSSADERGQGHSQGRGTQARESGQRQPPLPEDEDDGKEVLLAPCPAANANATSSIKASPVMADLISRCLPTNRRSKEPSRYYRDGMMRQGDGNNPTALETTKKRFRARDRPERPGFHPLQHGLWLFTSNGITKKRLLDSRRGPRSQTPTCLQALNNMAGDHHHLGSLAEERGDTDESDRCFSAPPNSGAGDPDGLRDNYSRAQNWLKDQRRGSSTSNF